jgi:hypothetical protein
LLGLATLLTPSLGDLWLDEGTPVEGTTGDGETAEMPPPFQGCVQWISDAGALKSHWVTPVSEPN